jgi:hypothetical protein
MPKHQALTAAGEHISIVAHITTEELRRRLTQDSMANGFANRFLFVYTQRIRELPEGGDLQIENLQPEADGPCAAFVSKLKKALREGKIRRLSGRKGGWGSRSARFRSMPTLYTGLEYRMMSACPMAVKTCSMRSNSMMEAFLPAAEYFSGRAFNTTLTPTSRRPILAPPSA